MSTQQANPDRKRDRQYVRKTFQARARLINRAARARLTNEGMRWYILVSTPQGDMAAQRILRDKGVYSIVPLDFRYRKASKYTKRKMRVVSPAMPGYLFVGMEEGEEDWPAILGLNVVRGVVGVDGCPKPVDGCVVLAFLQSGADKWSVPKEYKFMRSNKEFDIGDEVEIVVGPFSGQVTKVKAIEGSDAKIQLMVFGSTQDIAFPLDGLEAAS